MLITIWSKRLEFISSNFGWWRKSQLSFLCIGEKRCTSCYGPHFCQYRMNFLQLLTIFHQWLNFFYKPFLFFFMSLYFEGITELQNQRLTEVKKEFLRLWGPVPLLKAWSTTAVFLEPCPARFSVSLRTKTQQLLWGTCSCVCWSLQFFKESYFHA